MKLSYFFGNLIVGIAGISALFGANADSNQARGVRTVNVGQQSSNSPRMLTVPMGGITVIGNPAVQTTTAPVDTKNPLPTITPQPKEPEYTVSDCMAELKLCVENGALQGGIKDMFNEDVRNAIMNGMRLCQNIVDKCIAKIDIYRTSGDVWLDFNSRIVQPEYYNFVLRKTGLTPNQAENTCLLLDRNTYGSSFTAVNKDGYVNAEYDKQVGAYNSANKGSLTKDNTLGANINVNDYDANRGHYARWDATNAECLVRIAAYNKNEPIKNEWFGIGDGKYAEVWQRAGSTFSCNKDLFGFSLMNNTKKAAVISLPVGTVVGAGVGVGVGYGITQSKQAAADDAVNKADGVFLEKGQLLCENKDFVQELKTKIMNGYYYMVLESYLYDKAEASADGKSIDPSKSKKLISSWDKFGKEECEVVMGLNAKAKLYDSAIEHCLTGLKYDAVAQCINTSTGESSSPSLFLNIADANGTDYTRIVACCDRNGVSGEDYRVVMDQCLFKPLQISFAKKNDGNNPLCTEKKACRSARAIKEDLNRMRGLLSEIEPMVQKKVKGETVDAGAMMGKGAAVGAAVGLGTAGLATAITAFVERDNINCRVGDGLNAIGYGKSHTIDSLKDFYVKWNLRLPDSIMPTSIVVDKKSLNEACAQFNGKFADCPKVKINYKDANGTYVLIDGMCKLSGDLCVPDDTVAASHNIK